MYEKVENHQIWNRENLRGKQGFEEIPLSGHPALVNYKFECVGKLQINYFANLPLSFTNTWPTLYEFTVGECLTRLVILLIQSRKV